MWKFAILLALMPAPLLAKADPVMVEAISACIDEAENPTRAAACIGILSNICMEQPDGQTIFGMTQCAIAEAQAWDVLLNAEYQAARKTTDALDKGETAAFQNFAVRGEQLITAQRAWLAFRDANCLAAYGIYGSGSMRQIAGSQCRLNMTARRTLELRNLYRLEN